MMSKTCFADVRCETELAVRDIRNKARALNIRNLSSRHGPSAGTIGHGHDSRDALPTAYDVICTHERRGPHEARHIGDAPKTEKKDCAMSTSTPSPTESEIHIRDFLAANPRLDAELGEVQIMTDRYTNQEWAELIKETQRKVLSEVDQRGKEGAKGWKYEVPEMEGGGLAKTVDHTVLKLDAKEATVDALCAEARVEGFKVGHGISLLSGCMS
jgi:hypothetical protein